jgi:hypothetical protein
MFATFACCFIAGAADQNNDRVNDAAMSLNKVKNATVDHYAKFGALASTNGFTLAVPEPLFDRVLLSEGFLDKPFQTKLASTNNIYLAAAAATNATVGETVTAFDLDGEGGNDVIGTYVAYALLKGVAANDAKDLNDLIDGPGLGAALNAADTKGRVKFRASTNAAPVDVMFYLTHR